MRKLKSQEQIKKEKNRNIKIMSGFMLFVLILGTLGFAFSGSTSHSDSGSNGENGDSGGFVQPIIKYGNTEIPITVKEEFIKDINVSITKKLEDFSDKVLYIDFRENDYFASEIRNSLGLFVPDVRNSCYGACDSNLPEKSCEDNLIVFRDNETNSVRQENNCIFIEGDLKSVDAFIYHIFKQ